MAHVGPAALLEEHGVTAPIKLSIPLSDGDIRAGFQFFTGGSDTLTMDMLYRFTDILMPTVPRKVLRDALIASGNEIKISEVISILREEHAAGLFDPAASAFASMDPTNQGCLNEEFVQSLLAKTGMGQLSDEDLHMLLTERDIDRDNDGRVGLEDFRQMIPAHLPPPRLAGEGSNKSRTGGAGTSRRAAARRH